MSLLLLQLCHRFYLSYVTWQKNHSQTHVCENKSLNFIIQTCLSFATKEQLCCTLVQKLTEMSYWRPSWVWCNPTDRGFPSDKTETTVFPSKQPTLFYLIARVHMYLLQAHLLKLNTEEKAVIHRRWKFSASLGRYFLLVTNWLFLVTCSNKFPSIFSGNVAPRGSLWLWFP